ncbi:MULTISPECIES: MATE family efflux transporter [Halobacteriovorax]|uniref:Multidrug-efflux transporter n=1 Tax=Halobacteriovorax vibrionivorans TaxID=2152716 RepID=A0ABY0IGX7_9BACT|nr:MULTISPECIES: MATE family efflux transporter [Halobacteriovorax]AYF43591.1 MATE efflux family protein [Halobacteriovorax sp. BALOs_7]RZF21840.1 MATE family efflux transporter [Halobacteriovorax vibrionivorans]TGD48326.1 MATE family efflux transporter [Halobacteriovorax sp. Y22]
MEGRDLTQGSVIKSLFKLSVPIVMANFLQTAYQLTDTFWVGRLGTNAIASLSLSFPILFLLISMGAGFAVSGTILVAQYTGQRNTPMVSKVCLHTLIIILATSALLAGIAYAVIPYVIEAMTPTVEIQKITTSYLRISFIGLIFSYLYMMFQSLYRGVGDVKTPFYIVLFSVILNFIIDPILIMGWGPVPAYGVDGAAFATICTQGLSAIIALYLLAKGKGGIKINFKKIDFDFTLAKKIINLGFPASAEQSSRALAMTIMTFLIATFGDVVLAAYGIGIRVLTLMIIPSLGFAMATSTLVGQNIGAGKIERTKEVTSKALWVIFIVLTIAGIGFFIFAEQTLQIFVPGEFAVIKEGAVFIRVIALTFGLIGVQQVCSGAMRGGGSPMISMMVAIISLWVIRFPVAYLLSKHTQLAQVGIYFSFVVGNILGAAMAITIIKKNRWIKNLTDVFTPQENKVMEEVIKDDIGYE